MENPFAPPRADLAAPDAGGPGPRIPWEDRTAHPALGERLMATLRWLAQRPSGLGPALAAPSDLVAPIGFFALLALPLTVVTALLGAFFPVQPFWQAWMGLPAPPQPEGLARTIALLAATLGAPFGLALGVLIMGLLTHAGLWAVGATRQKLGLTATFRTLLYGSAAGTLAAFPLALAQFLPGVAGQMGQIVHTLATTVGLTTWYGLLYARAHRTDTWRGVLGAWLPLVAFLLCCGACLGSLFAFGGEAFREALSKGLRGGM